MNTTNPVTSKINLIELSHSYKEAVVLRIIIQEKICRLWIALT